MNAKGKAARQNTHWISGSMDPAHKGLLHRELHVAQDAKIPAMKLRKAAKGGDSGVAKRARLALTLRKL